MFNCPMDFTMAFIPFPEKYSLQHKGRAWEWRQKSTGFNDFHIPQKKKLFYAKRKIPQFRITFEPSLPECKQIWAGAHGLSGFFLPNYKASKMGAGKKVRYIHFKKRVAKQKGKNNLPLIFP